MQHPDKKIFACLDGANLADAVCDYAAWLCQRASLPLELLHTINHHQETAAVADLSGNIGLGSQEHLLEEMITHEQQQSKIKIQHGKQLMQAAKERVKKAGIETLNCQLRHGSLIDTLIEQEEAIKILVIGVRGKIHQDQDAQIGAKIEGIVRALHRPVLIVNHPFKTPKHIMIAYDGSPAADKAVELLTRCAIFKDTHCHLVCVKSNQASAESLLQQAANKLKAASTIKLTTAKLKGRVEEELCEYQQQNKIDLTLMGAFSHHRLHDVLLGSFTHKMLVKSKMPLMLFR